MQVHRGVPMLEGIGHVLPPALLVVAEVGVGSAVPDEHPPRAVLAFGDDALEVGVPKRVILGRHRQPLVSRVHRGSLRHRPGLEHAVHFEPEVKVVGAGGMLLDDEAAAVTWSLACLPGGLSAALQVPLASVGIQGQHLPGAVLALRRLLRHPCSFRWPAACRAWPGVRWPARECSTALRPWSGEIPDISLLLVLRSASARRLPLDLALPGVPSGTRGAETGVPDNATGRASS